MVTLPKMGLASGGSTLPVLYILLQVAALSVVLRVGPIVIRFLYFRVSFSAHFGVVLASLSCSSDLAKVY